MVKTEELALPSFGPKQNENMDDYAVRVLRADLSDPQSLAELEIVLTRGMQGKGVMIIDRDKYTFLERYFMIITYWEKRAS